ncbi:Uncharacterised protein [Candidatus Burarchaeum australiense]|nr:Uncharacterised protein [Candidatus Burarchaeum australiense]
MDIMSMPVGAKNPDEIQRTSKNIKVSLKALHRRLGRRPNVEEVEQLLRSTGLRYARHAKMEAFDAHANCGAHSFEVHLKGNRLYVCEVMDNGGWAVL